MSYSKSYTARHVLFPKFEGILVPKALLFQLYVISLKSSRLESSSFFGMQQCEYLTLLIIAHYVGGHTLLVDYCIG